MVINNYRELTLANDYIFSKVMRNKALEVEYMTLLMREQERYEDGLREGWQKGLLDSLISLVRDGLLSAADAANRVGMSEEAFMKLIK